MSNTFKTAAATMVYGKNASDQDMIEHIKDSRVKEKFEKLNYNKQGYRFGDKREYVAKSKVRDRRLQRKRDQRQFEREQIQEHNELMLELQTYKNFEDWS